jgi:hypothetical protein
MKKKKINNQPTLVHSNKRFPLFLISFYLFIYLFWQGAIWLAYLQKQICNIEDAQFKESSFGLPDIHLCLLTCKVLVHLGFSLCEPNPS